MQETTTRPVREKTKEVHPLQELAQSDLSIMILDSKGAVKSTPKLRYSSTPTTVVIWPAERGHKLIFNYRPGEEVKKDVIFLSDGFNQGEYIFQASRSQVYRLVEKRGSSTRNLPYEKISSDELQQLRSRRS